MIARPGRYLEINIKDALWNAGAEDFLKDGYSIQALFYEWNGVYPNNYQTKSNIVLGEEVLLPFKVEPSSPSTDSNDQILSPFLYTSNLQSRGETLKIEVTCK